MFRRPVDFEYAICDACQCDRRCDKNVIPFFGPYIGAIPSANLILLAEPKMGIYFIIFIIALQQFDGNVLGPKILGDSTGLSAFWVVFSNFDRRGSVRSSRNDTWSSGTFAVVYYIVEMLVNNKLEKKNCLSRQMLMTNIVMRIGQNSHADKNISKKRRDNVLPIRVQNDLPVKEILEHENIFVMDEYRAAHQDDDE